MSHDFARSQRLKKESSARKKRPAPKKSGGVPSWLWLLAGTLFGFLIMLLVYLAGLAPPLPRLQGEQQAATAGQPSAKKEEPAAPAKRVSPVFEFYTKLPEGGQPITTIPAGQPEPGDVAPAGKETVAGKEAAASKDQPAATGTTAAQPAAPLDPIQQLLAEQEAAKAAAIKAAATARPDAPAKTEAAKADTGKPDAGKPEAGKPVTRADPAKLATAKGEPKKPVEPTKQEAAKPDMAKTPATASPPAAATKGRYLQAGAFRSKAEVDRQRAKISLLGMRPSVVTVTNAKGESLQKVVVGPFSSDKDMESARILLGGNGISSIPTR